MKNSNLIVTIFVLVSLISVLYVCGCTSTGNGPQTPTSTPTIPTPTPAPITPTTTTPTPPPPPPPSTTSLTITSPKDGSVVDYRRTIKGTSKGVHGSSNYISIIVQPHESGEYWVQPEVQPSPNGDWSVLVYFGDDATAKYKDKKFTVFALINSSRFAEGKISPLPGGIKETIELTRS